MTIDEALTELEKAKGNVEALRMAREALEKQIEAESKPKRRIDTMTKSEFCKALTSYISWQGISAEKFYDYITEIIEKE